MPPGATMKRMPGSIMSTSVSPSASLTTVPTGTGSSSASPGGAGAVVAHAEAAVAGGAVRRVVVRQQRRDLRVGDEHDVAAVTAVAAVGAGERLELLALDRHAAVAALAGAQVQRHPVDECDHALPLRIA